MSETLLNVFGWSQSRDRTFGQCRRQYYYSHYGHWGGWEPTADPLTRETWILKQLQSRHMWLGDVVHRSVAFALTYARHQRELPLLEETLARVDRHMREEFRASRDDRLRQRGKSGSSTDPQTPRFFEHEYQVKIGDGVWRTIHGQALRAVRNFVDSQIVRDALAVPTERWLSIEELGEFDLADVLVRVRLDFAYVDGEILYIVDWKTGSRPAPPASLQLACYALYANRTWHVPIERIRTREVNLVRNVMVEHRVTSRDVEIAARYIRGSAAEMRGLLADPDENLARIDDFDPVRELRICRSCNFQRICLGGPAADVLREDRLV